MTKEEAALHYIDESGYQSGTVLIGQIDQEVGRMHSLVRENMEASTKVYFWKYDDFQRAVREK